MTTIDTSAAAIEKIRSLWESEYLPSLDESINAFHVNANDYNDARVTVRTLLAALDRSAQQASDLTEQWHQRECHLQHKIDLLTQEWAEMRRAIDEHNRGCTSACQAKGSERCLPYTSRGRNCPDCPVDDIIECDPEMDAALAESDSQLSEVSQASAELHRRLAERDAENDRLSAECFGNLEEIASLKRQLAAHDACLTQVREEMPEVGRIDSKATLISGVTDDETKLKLIDDIMTLVNIVRELQQNEARWRNSRDIWEAERKRLQDQLSASNAACAEMRECLQIVQQRLKEDCAVFGAEPKSLHRIVLYFAEVKKIEGILAAQPKQQIVAVDDRGQPVYELQKQQDGG